MNNRIISMVLTFAIMISCMVVSVSADEVNNWIELLDYGYSNFGTNHISLPAVSEQSRLQIRYDNPTGMTMNEVEVLFRTDEPTPRVETNSSNLTVVKVYDNVYRAYGSLTQNLTSAYIYLYYQTGTYVDILSFKVGIKRYQWDYCDVLGNISIYDGASYSLNYSNSLVSTEWTRKVSDGDSISSTTWYATLTLSEWKKFDYIDILLNAYVYDVGSIVVNWNNGAVPYTLHYMDNVDASLANQMFVIRIDLTELNRHNNIDVVIRLSGDSFVQGTTTQPINSLSIASCIGYYISAEPNIITYWFLQLRDWFNELISAVGGNADTSEMENEVDNIKDQMQNASDVMSDFTRPNVDEVFQDVELDIGSDTPFADMMSSFFENEFIVSIITGSLGFTLFGILVG